MAEPIRVIVRRGEVVEATHLVHAVAVRDGRTVAEAGDAALVTLLRSSAKPFQALPLARAYEDLDPRELAIASASHLAGSEQLAAVRRRGSSTTAPASTPACSPSAARTAGAPRATATRITACSGRTCRTWRAQPASTRTRSPVP